MNILPETRRTNAVLVRLIALDDLSPFHPPSLKRPAILSKWQRQREQDESLYGTHRPFIRQSLSSHPNPLRILRRFIEMHRHVACVLDLALVCPCKVVLQSELMPTW